MLTGLAKYYNFTPQEREDFYQKHNLNSHPSDDLIELARSDLKLCLKYNGADLEPGDMDWLIEPLTDLGETQLLNQILEQKEKLGL